MKKLTLALLSVLLMINSYGTEKTVETYNCLFFNSYIKGEMDSWPDWIAEIDRMHHGELEWELLKLKAEYGLIGYYFGTRQKSKAREMVEKADSELNDIVKKFPGNAALHSYKAALYAFKISLSIYKAPILGPKMTSSIQQAFAINPSEPMAWLQQGNAFYNRPGIFGGDKLKGLEDFKTAHELFLLERAPCNYLLVLTKIFIIKAYLETDQLEAYRSSRESLEKQYGPMPWIDDFLEINLMD